MKIQNVGSYVGFTENAKINKKEETTVKARKYDIIDIKSRSSNKEEVKLSDIKKNIVSDVEKRTSSEKLEGLKASIADETYKINIEEIMKRMMV